MARMTMEEYRNLKARAKREAARWSGAAVVECVVNEVLHHLGIDVIEDTTESALYDAIVDRARREAEEFDDGPHEWRAYLTEKEAAAIALVEGENHA